MNAKITYSTDRRPGCLGEQTTDADVHFWILVSAGRCFVGGEICACGCGGVVERKDAAEAASLQPPGGHLRA